MGDSSGEGLGAGPDGTEEGISVEESDSETGVVKKLDSDTSVGLEESGSMEGSEVIGKDKAKDEGDSIMELKEALDRISELEKQVKEKSDESERLSKDNESKDRRIAELYTAESELRDEKDNLKSGILKQWKLNRAADFSGEELVRYEKRLDSMDIWNLKLEHGMVMNIGKQLGLVKEDPDAAENSESAEGSAEGSEGKESVGKGSARTQRDPRKSLEGDQVDEDKSIDPPPPSSTRSWGEGVYPTSV